MIRTLGIVGVVAIAGWWTLFLRDKLNEHEDALRDKDRAIEELGVEVEQKAARIVELDEEVAEQAEQIRELDAAMRLLKVDHRLARIEVLSQEPDEEGVVQTRLKFTELDSEGLAFGPGRELTVAGRRVYLESLVVKFDDNFVEGGDFLRGTSVCFFRRAFGEDQKPTDGEPLDVAGRRPRIYTGDMSPDPFYDDLWTRFWDYANDPDEAQARGVRAIHGEAPFMEVVAGKTYQIELRASGGLTIRAE
ncbi:MAG: hypothetical protein AAF682_10625 [Planctomycetota bacterium]